MNYRELNAPDLVKEWKKAVNDHVNISRDAALIKRKLELMSPVQIMLGMLQYKGARTITIPQFLSQEESWYLDDEELAEIELARALTGVTTEDYYVFRDLEISFNPKEIIKAQEAFKNLKVWAERVIT